METTRHFNWEFETITKHTLDIIIIVNQDQIVKYVTQSLEAILGFSPEEFIGKNAFDQLHPEDRERLMAAHREVVITKQPRVDEYRVFHKNGEIKYFESRVTLIPNQLDNLVVVSIRDITSRKRLEVEIENRKNRYQSLQYSLKKYSRDLSTVMNVSDLKNRLLKELLTMVPEAEPKMVIYHREEHTVEGDLNIGLKPSLSTLAVGKLQYINNQILILIGERKDQACILAINPSSIKELMDLIWFETLIYYTTMVFESLNIIENLLNQLEEALKRNERPQWILRLLFNISEKQRLELSSDLHDTVLGNQLELYKNLETILKDYQFENTINEELKGIIQGLLNTINQIRMTCNELRPPLLKELGLEAALENLFDYTQEISTFKIMFTTENTTEGLSLSEEETISIYRITQELLNNASKHSQATNLHFKMTKQEDSLELQYSDNGKGLDVERLTPSFKSMGLSGMRERVKSLNGSIEFHSEPGNGLIVKMKFPTSILKKRVV
ncbi:PAS domain S-box protein [Bacillus sp. CGMCC 1.16607]|uniref:PAS domain-containing sensor histidine kinase n=1 Tax=Bacillus sp. CGMCC 1.16607 TaxID=3351842 RepID=UPI003644544C